VIAPRSIRFRLTAWYAGTLLAFLLAGAAAFDAVMREVLAREFARSTASSLTAVRGFFRLEVGEYHWVDTTVAHMATEVFFPDRRVTFLRPNGETFVPRDTTFRIPVVTLAPPVRVVESALDPDLAPGWRVRVESSAAGMQDAITRIDRSMAIAIAILVVVSAAGGWWLTGRTLRPVRDMAEAAERISAASSSGRMPIDDPQDELGRLGARFNALLDRLDRALVQQRQFLAAAAHELRTPVARMRSQVELALQHEPAAGAGDGEHDRAVLAAMDQELGRASLLVNDLLQLARADADPHPARLERAFLDDVVVDVAQTWRAAARRRGVTLELEVIQETPARIDAVLIARLAGILLDNAIRYTPEGGRVAVRVMPADRLATLEVEDTGIGIPEPERDRVFERFFRGARARAAAPEGSGLGLPIARWIADQHHATIALLAGRDGGTLVRVTFPLAA